MFLFSIICSLGSSKKNYGLFHALLCSFNCFESYRYTCKCSASHFKWLKERAPLCNDLMETTLYTERQWVLSSCKASYILNTYFQHSLCSKENCITSTSVKTQFCTIRANLGVLVCVIFCWSLYCQNVKLRVRIWKHWFYG